MITDIIAAPGIWMDYTNVNSRCSGNVIINADRTNGGIFMDASQKPNLVDTNFVWGTHGNGIYQHDCDELIIAHNFVGKSADAAVRMQICQGRIVKGRLSTAKRNKILNNIFFDNVQQLAIWTATTFPTTTSSPGPGKTVQLGQVARDHRLGQAQLGNHPPNRVDLRDRGAKVGGTGGTPGLPQGTRRSR